MLTLLGTVDEMRSLYKVSIKINQKFSRLCDIQHESKFNISNVK